MPAITYKHSFLASSKKLLLSVSLLSLVSGAAYAADLDPLKQAPAEEKLAYPLIEGSFVFELENDTVFRDEGDDEFSDTFNTTELGLDVRFNKYFSLHTDITLEAVDNPDRNPRTPGDNIFFEDHGFFFETLHLQAEIDNATFYGGKINPAFGSAWDATPGIYGVDFAEDYELTERIGFGGSYTLKPEGYGEHTLNAALFFADTSGLSRSFGTNRGRLREEDGGASNTENLESFALALDGGEFENLSGFSYNLGFRYQSAGEGGVDNEIGFAAGAIQEFALNDDLGLTLNGEIAYFDNFDSGESNNLYATIGAGLTYNKWFGDAAFAVRDISANNGGDDFTDLQFQAGIGREIFEKASVELGYRYLREEDNSSHTIGTFFVYETDFRILR